ncbi:MAG: hypothetical protein M3P30_06775 [Chloroflexota bacterium]|nr:hypothetical protein [Chloroflexota bacterium]
MPDLSPRYEFNAFHLTVDPPSRDFFILYQPNSTKDPRALLRLRSHRPSSYPAGDNTKITTPAGNEIWVGSEEDGYSGDWTRGVWDYQAVVLDTDATHNDIVSEIADAVFAAPIPNYR